MTEFPRKGGGTHSTERQAGSALRPHHRVLDPRLHLQPQGQAGLQRAAEAVVVPKGTAKPLSPRLPAPMC